MQTCPLDLDSWERISEHCQCVFKFLPNIGKKLVNTHTQGERGGGRESAPSQDTVGWNETLIFPHSCLERNQTQKNPHPQCSL